MAVPVPPPVSAASSTPRTWWRTAGLTVAAGAAATVGVVVVRVLVDVAEDPTSHNLWPFELVIAGMLGLVAGLVAAGLGEVVLRLRRA